MNRKLLAQALLEMALERSQTTVLADVNIELIEAAKKLNIVLPSPDLAVIKTVYAEVDKPNRNGVILPKEAAIKGLPTLLGKQVNWEHEGSGRVCGYIIDVGMKNDKIEVVAVLFKSLFREEMEEVQRKFDEHTLAVSFEIWDKNPQTRESVVHNVGHKYISIDPILYHGMGLLLTKRPACQKALVYKLLAEIDSKEAQKSFEKDLVCASEAIIDLQYQKYNHYIYGGGKVDETLIEFTEEEITLAEDEYVSIEDAKKLTYEQKKGLPDSDYAVVITVKNKVTGEPRKIRMFVINDEAHVRNALARLAQTAVQETLKKLGVSIEEVKNKILKRAKELNMTDLLKRHEKATEEPKTNAPAAETKTEEKSVAETKAEEPKVEDPKVETSEQQVMAKPSAPKKIVKIITEDSVITTEIPSEGESKTIRKGLRKRTCFFDDGTEEVFSEEFEVVNTYSQAQLEEAVNAARTEKDAEIVALKAEQEKQLKEKDEKIATQTQELGKKDQEIAALTKVEEPKTKENMEVGSVEEARKASIALTDEITRRAFPQPKK